MKKLLVVFSLSVFLLPWLVFAETNISSDRNIQAYVDKTSSVAGSPISLQVKFMPEGRGCGGSIAYDRLILMQNGGAIATVYNSSPVDGEQFTYNNVVVNSSVAGTVNMAVEASCSDGTNYFSPVTINIGSLTFTAPQTQAPTAVIPSTSNRATSATAPTATTATATPPAVPVLENYNVELGKTFSGTTIPNGIVHLYFHSDPFEDTTTADAAGAWTYELTRDIGTGDHELQIAVTDPATNLTSEKSDVVKFSLTDNPGLPTINDNVNVGTQPPLNWWYVGGGVLLSLLLAGLGFYIWKKKRSKKTSSVKSKSVEPDLDQISTE